MSNYPNDVLHPEGPDWDENRTRPWNCRKCGRFVSHKPVEFQIAIPNGYPLPDGGWVQTGPDDVYLEYAYPCTRCGEGYIP
jgi:hypothetical protein